MALVFQDTELFSSNIRDNVSYGLEDVSDRQIIDALKKANAHEFVQKFKNGLDEQIGERGVKLSGGQKLVKQKGLYQELLQYQIAGNKKLLSKYELR